MEAAATSQGLSSAEAARRLERLGPAEPETSRSVASIVAANVLTLFNGIIGVFFILILSLGLWADALFGQNGPDQLHGGAGPDLFSGGHGPDAYDDVSAAQGDRTDGS